MTFFKKAFEHFKNEHSPVYIIKHAIKPNKLKCSCTFDKEEYDVESHVICPKCLGTTHIYKASLLRLRKTSQNAGDSLTNNRIKGTDAITTRNEGQRFFFETSEKINEQDFIIEKTTDYYKIYFVNNTGFQIGDKGVPIYKVALAEELVIEKQDIKKAMTYIKKELSISSQVKMRDYIGEIPDSIFDTDKFISKNELTSLLGDIIENENLVTFDDMEAKNIIYNKYGLNNVDDALDEALYVYPVILHFDNNINVAQMGSTVTSVSLSWQYNKPVTQQLINENLLDIDTRETSISENITADKTYTLQAQDGKNTVNDTTSIWFYNNMYYGSDFGNYSLENLNRVLSEKIKGFMTLNIANQEYFYYIYPTRLGTSVFAMDDEVTLYEQKDLINESGYSEPYYIYRSNNHSLGEIHVEIK